MGQITLFTWIGFSVFLVLMLAVGYLSSKKMKSISDFATGGGTFGPYVLGFSFAATYLVMRHFWVIQGGHMNGGCRIFCCSSQ